MSRRGRHGRHQNPGAPGRPRPGAAQATERPASPADGRAPTRPDGAAERIEAGPATGAEPVAAAEVAAAPVARFEAPREPVAPVAETPAPAMSAVASAPAPTGAPIAPSPGAPRPEHAARPEPIPGQARPGGEGDDGRPTCTVAQLRRFIKSRPWIPMHELRRRFGIWGGDDDVSPIRVGAHTLFIGLPPAEARLMAELLGGGDVGFELSLDPVTPIVVGVYPMRPVPRG